MSFWSTHPFSEIQMVDIDPFLSFDQQTRYRQAVKKYFQPFSGWHCGIAYRVVSSISGGPGFKISRMANFLNCELKVEN